MRLGGAFTLDVGCTFLLALPCLQAQTTTPTLEAGVAIHVRETAGVDRVDEPATFGVPIAEDEGIHDVSRLAVFDPDGKRVAAQFRVLERWRASPLDDDHPIKWVLVDLQMDVAANSSASYLLRDTATLVTKAEKKKPKAPRLSVEKKGPRFNIDTGNTRFAISTKRANFLESVRTDLDGDGKLESNELVLDGFDAPGFVLTDRLGVEYTSANHEFSVVVEEAGPLRKVIRVDGRHAPTDPTTGIGRDFLRFTTRYTFHAGKPWIRVQHTLKNDYLTDPLGAIGFESYTLPLRLRTQGGNSSPTFRGSFGLGDGTTFSQAGALRLYQDSDGGVKWNLASNTTFSGYRVLDSATAGEGAIVSAGAQAAGWAAVGGNDHGVSLVMRDFFENFPKGFAFNGESQLRFDLFPAETASFFWLDDAQQKTTEFTVMPWTKSKKGVEFDQVAFSKRVNNPLRPFIEPEYMRRSKAWGDHGNLDDPPQSDTALLTFDSSKLNELYQQAFARSNYAFGWADFGEYFWAKSTHTTGSPRNKLTYFDRFAINGSTAAFRINELFAMHSRDLRTYHMGEFDFDDFPLVSLYEGIVAPGSIDKLGRNTLPSTLAPHKAGIPSNGKGWNGFDIEHMSVDDLYEYYLLTGDPVSYDSLVSIGQAMRTWPFYIMNDPVGSSRGVGWSLRAMIRIWRVTGDENILQLADMFVAVTDSTYNKATPSPITGEVYHWVTRYLPSAHHIEEAEFDIPWQLATVIHGMLLHHRETGEEMSKLVALDVADYLVEDCWDPSISTMHEALACDDDSIINPKPDNTGVNTWIPSALAIAYRFEPRVEYLGYAQSMYNSVPSLQSWNSYYGFGMYHWWHDYRALILGY